MTANSSKASHVRAKNTDGLVFQMEFPGLGKFPVNNWWRVRSPKTKPKNNFMPGVAPGSFLHVLPSYVHTVHKTLYFTQYIIPMDRYHLYNMCAITGNLEGIDKALVEILLQDFQCHSRQAVYRPRSPRSCAIRHSARNGSHRLIKTSSIGASLPCAMRAGT